MLNPDFFPASCKLSGRVAVYVPGTVDADHAADNAEMVEYTAAELSRLFGGATAQPAAGYWLSEVHGLRAVYTLTASPAPQQQHTQHTQPRRTSPAPAGIFLPFSAPFHPFPAELVYLPISSRAYARTHARKMTPALHYSPYPYHNTP